MLQRDLRAVLGTLIAQSAIKQHSPRLQNRLGKKRVGVAEHRIAKSPEPTLRAFAAPGLSSIRHNVMRSAFLSLVHYLSRFVQCQLCQFLLFEYFNTTPPVKSCCVETRDKLLEVIPCLKSGRPLPKITGAIPMRYSSNRLSFINVSERFALPKT